MCGVSCFCLSIHARNAKIFFFTYSNPRECVGFEAVNIMCCYVGGAGDLLSYYILMHIFFKTEFVAALPSYCIPDKMEQTHVICIKDTVARQSSHPLPCPTSC